MIIQGSNEPIIFDLGEELTDAPTQSLSISLRNEIEELKHWDYADCVHTHYGLHVEAPITQEESVEWELGPCVIEAKWLDADGNTLFVRAQETIVPWGDHRILEE